MKKVVRTKDYKFLAIINPAEEGGFYAYCPLLPGCVTQGDTHAETIANIEEAIELYLEVANDVGDSIPQDAIIDKSFVVDVPVKLPAELVLA